MVLGVSPVARSYLESAEDGAASTWARPRDSKARRGKGLEGREAAGGGDLSVLLGHCR